MTGSSYLLIAALSTLLLGSVSTSLVAAGGPPPGTPVVVGANKGRTTYTATVATNGRGVWINVRATRSSSGSSETPANSSGAGSDNGAVSAVSYTGAGSGSAATSDSASTVTRTWYNAEGEPYYETADGHVYHLAGVNIGNASSGSNGWFTTGSRQHPGSVPESLYVDGHLQGIVWVPYGTKLGSLQWGSPPSGSTIQSASAPVVLDPRAIALDLLRHVPLPSLRLRMNPALGLVAMPSWFWAEGYTGQPFGGSVTVGSYTIAVRVWPISYQWDFGDGTTITSSDLGQAYPAQSDIRHTYQYSSLRYPNGFPVRLTVQFAAAYSVNGGALNALPGMQQTYADNYPVQQLQSVLTDH